MRLTISESVNIIINITEVLYSTSSR